MHDGNDASAIVRGSVDFPPKRQQQTQRNVCMSHKLPRHTAAPHVRFGGIERRGHDPRRAVLRAADPALTGQRERAATAAHSTVGVARRQVGLASIGLVAVTVAQAHPPLCVRCVACIGAIGAHDCFASSAAHKQIHRCSAVLAIAQRFQSSVSQRRCAHLPQRSLVEPKGSDTSEPVQNGLGPANHSNNNCAASSLKRTFTTAARKSAPETSPCRRQQAPLFQMRSQIALSALRAVHR